MPYVVMAEAFGRVTDAAAPATGFIGRGCTVADGGAGIYAFTLERALDINESHITTEQITTLLKAEWVHTSDTVKTATFLTVAAGNAATDSLFACAFWRFAYGNQ